MMALDDDIKDFAAKRGVELSQFIAEFNPALDEGCDWFIEEFELDTLDLDVNGHSTRAALNRLFLVNPVKTVLWMRKLLVHGMDQS